MRNITELREDIAVMGMSFGYIDKLLLKRYGTAVAPYYCHLCGQCEATCPNSIAISSINRCLMYAEAYRSPALAKSTYHEIPLSLSASTCLDCTDCVAKCVNGLDIPVKMKMARKLLV